MRVGIARAFFFDELEPAASHASVDERDRDVFAREVIRVEDVAFPVDAENDGDASLTPSSFSRSGAASERDWRTTPVTLLRSRFAEFFKSERPTVTRVRSPAQAALKAYQAEVDRLFDRVDVDPHANRPGRRPAHRRPDRRREDPAQHLALQRRRHPAISIPLPNYEAYP